MSSCYIDYLAEVRSLVRYPTYDEAEIRRGLNLGLDEIAVKLRLPDLVTSWSVPTVAATPYLSLPADYQTRGGGLMRCYSAANSAAVPIQPSYPRLLDSYPALDQAGALVMVCPVGGKLYYQGIPTTPDTLTLRGYRKPIPFADVLLNLSGTKTPNYGVPAIGDTIAQGVSISGKIVKLDGNYAYLTNLIGIFTTAAVTLTGTGTLTGVAAVATMTALKSAQEADGLPEDIALRLLSAYVARNINRQLAIPGLTAACDAVYREAWHDLLIYLGPQPRGVRFRTDDVVRIT